MDTLIRSSLLLDGKEILLCPETMRFCGSGIYERALPGGLVCTVETEKPEENSLCLLLRLRNDGEKPTGQISCIRTLDMTAPAETVSFHSLKGDSCGSESYNPIDRVFRDGDSFHAEPTGGRPSNTTAFPFFDLTDGETSWVFGIGWLGQWCMDLSVQKGAVRLQAGLSDADFFLNPGESVRTVRVLIVKGGTLAETRRAFRRTMLTHFSPRTRLGDKAKLPTSLQSFDLYFYNEAYACFRGEHKRRDWNTESGQLLCADAAARCQYLDALWLDAAWFREGFPEGVGNYACNPGFPRGLRPVTDYAHKKGLDFVLWFEPERVHRRSDLFREHRDMLLDHPDREDDYYLFNLADDRARAWLTETLIAFLRESNIDVYRQDFNIDPLPFWRANDGENRRGITEIRYVTGHYALWDELLNTFPHLRIDNCASGGRRIELETCLRAFPLWRSDTGCKPVSETRRGHTWNQNHILALTEYLPFHSCASWETEPYDLRSAYSGGLACVFDVLNPDFPYDDVIPRLCELRRVQKYWQGEFTSLTKPDNAETVWAAWQLSLENCGMVCAFRRDACPEEKKSFSLRDIDENDRYSVWVTDEALHTTERMLSGRELKNFVFSAKAPRESILLEYQKER